MPLSFNQVNLCGTLTRDLELAYTPKGTAVAKFSLAINRTWKDDQGTKHEECDFIDCEAWGKTAEIMGEWTAKGHTIFIQGRLKHETWTDKETDKKRSKIKVVVEKMNFVSKPKGETEVSDNDGGDDPCPRSRREELPKKQRPVRDPDLDAEEEDDIPY